MSKVQLSTKQMVEAISETPQQCAFAIDLQATRCTALLIADHKDQMVDPISTAAYLRNLADLLDPEGA